MKNAENTDTVTSVLIRFIKKHWVLLLLFVGVPMILLFGYFYTKTSFKYLNYLDRENHKYSMVRSIDKVIGVTDSVYSSRGGSFVTLKDSSKIWFEVSRNKTYKKYLLCDFLQKNDSLVKQINSDTLFIYRDRKLYYFVLGSLDK